MINFNHEILIHRIKEMTTFTECLKVWYNNCQVILVWEFQDYHRNSHRLSVQMFVSAAEGMVHVACHCIGHAFWICLIHHPNVGIACIETLLCTVTYCQTCMSQSLLFMPLFPATLLVGTLQNKHETHVFVCSSQEPSHL